MVVVEATEDAKVEAIAAAVAVVVRWIIFTVHMR